jgi:hypothetical protein
VDYESSDVENQDEDNHLEEVNEEINDNYDEINSNELAQFCEGTLRKGPFF